MIDISHKYNSLRTAKATARVVVREATILAIKSDSVPKGDPLVTARIAAIQAAKKTGDIIPYCHPVPLDFVGISFNLGQNFIDIEAEVKAIYKTGVEMEAMAAALIASLTIYDMLKMIDDEIIISDVRLTQKTGGKSDLKVDTAKPLRAAVLVLSDSTANHTRIDTSGHAIQDRLVQEKIDIADFRILPDDIDAIVEHLTRYADIDNVDVVITTGGTGLGPRDVTPEATRAVIETELPGISEALRQYGSERNTRAALSRATAGRRGNTIIVNLPGSERAVRESLEIVIPLLKHAVQVMNGEQHDAQNIGLGSK